MALNITQLQGLLGIGGATAAAYLPYKESGDQIDYLKERVPEYTAKADEITASAADAAQFTPFTVKSATGGSTAVDAAGGISQMLSDPERDLMTSMFGRAQDIMAQPTASGDELYRQMQATMAGENERNRLALENRLAAQGRLGVGTAAFGGTPEALAMEKAIQEQSSKNWLSAQSLAPQLANQQISGAMAALQGAYAPQTQGLAALAAASPFSQLATSANLSRAEQLSSGGQYGLEAMVAGDQTIGSLESARTQALAETLKGLFGTSASGESTASSLLESIFS